MDQEGEAMKLDVSESSDDTLVLPSSPTPALASEFDVPILILSDGEEVD